MPQRRWWQVYENINQKPKRLWAWWCFRLLFFSTKETASINAFHSALPRSIIKGCFFQFCPSELEKHSVARRGFPWLPETLRLLLKSFIELAFIPQCDLKLVFKCLNDPLGESSQIIPYVKFFDKVWIGAIFCTKRQSASFPPDLWNQFKCTRDQKQKTNTSVEGWHQTF